MRVDLAYGRGVIGVDFPDGRTTVIQPGHQPGLANERAALVHALSHPIAANPLAQWLKPGARICILFTDRTRATPNERIIPWLLAELESAGVRREQITLLNQLGTHLPNSRSELEQMLTPAVVNSYRVLNHEPENPEALVQVGVTRRGRPARINRHFVEADVRIVTGFIEPHFFAGFSGGPKGIMPGVAALETVIDNHGVHHISHANATFGITHGNALWEELRDIALLAGPSFLLNVTMNEARQITGVFAGHLVEAHRAGCEFVRKTAMQPVAQLFDTVVTTNSGFPLDLNLYQGVKGLSAAARIVRPGGTLILACECSQGVPSGSSFENILRSGTDPAAVLAFLASAPAPLPEQWQAQIQALVQAKARVLLYSSLSEAQARGAHLQPCADIGAAIQNLPGDARIAVLPQGPLTIPYLV